MNMSVDEAMQYAQYRLEQAFEEWLRSDEPSGDCESVQRQWDGSRTHQELVDELQPVMVLTWEVNQLRTELDQERKRLDWALSREAFYDHTTQVFFCDRAFKITKPQARISTDNPRATIDEIMGE
jgi:hypothetical protein